MIVTDFFLVGYGNAKMRDVSNSSEGETVGIWREIVVLNRWESALLALASDISRMDRPRKQDCARIRARRQCQNVDARHVQIDIDLITYRE